MNFVDLVLVTSFQRKTNRSPQNCFVGSSSLCDFQSQNVFGSPSYFRSVPRQSVCKFKSALANSGDVP